MQQPSYKNAADQGLEPYVLRRTETLEVFSAIIRNVVAAAKDSGFDISHWEPLQILSLWDPIRVCDDSEELTEVLTYLAEHQ